MLRFNYSWIYDKQIHWWKKSKYDEDSYKKVNNYIKRLEKEWKELDKKVFDVISKVSGLKWKNKNIECYVVSDLVYPFSSPLTITIHTNISHQIEIIIHELIHNIWIQNEDGVKFKDYRKYGKLNFNVKIHILVHAIEKEVLLRLFIEKRTKKYIKWYDKFPDYKKAWDIVEREGSKNIIKEWIK